jgi:hypothetical protein
MDFLQPRLFAEQKPLLHMPDIDWPGWDIGRHSEERRAVKSL